MCDLFFPLVPVSVSAVSVAVSSLVTAGLWGGCCEASISVRQVGSVNALV